MCCVRTFVLVRDISLVTNPEGYSVSLSVSMRKAPYCITPSSGDGQYFTHCSCTQGEYSTVNKAVCHTSVCTWISIQIYSSIYSKMLCISYHLYTVPYILLPVHGTLYPTTCTRYPMHATLYPTTCTRHPISYYLYTVPYILLPVHATLYPTTCTHYPISYYLYTLPYILLPVHGTLYSTTYTRYPISYYLYTVPHLTIRLSNI